MSTAINVSVSTERVEYNANQQANGDIKLNRYDLLENRRPGKYDFIINRVMYA